MKKADCGASLSDRRRMTGRRELFGPSERDLWYTVRLMRQLTPEARWRVRRFVEACLSVASQDTLAAPDARE